MSEGRVASRGSGSVGGAAESDLLLEGMVDDLRRLSNGGGWNSPDIAAGEVAGARGRRRSQLERGSSNSKSSEFQITFTGSYRAVSASRSTSSSTSSGEA